MQISGVSEDKKRLNPLVINEDGSIITSSGSVPDDQVSVNSVDWDNSDFSDFDGDPMDLFGLPALAAGITSKAGVVNPSFTMRFKQTTEAAVFGAGATVSGVGGFKNIKVEALGSNDTGRGVLDLSEDSFLFNSIVYKQEKFEFNALRVTFFTSDEVKLTNVFIKNETIFRKQNYVLKWGVVPSVNTGEVSAVHDLGDVYIFTTTPQPYYISSSSVNDSVSVEVELIILDGIYYRRDIQTVILDGQNPVKIPTYNNLNVVAINRAFNSNSVDLQGVVYIYEEAAIADGITGGVPDDLSFARAAILVGKNQTQQAVYTVPELTELGQRVIRANIFNWNAIAIRNRTVSGIVELKVAKKGKISRVQATDGLSEGLKSGDNFGENTPLEVDAGSDVYVEVSELTTNNIAVKAGFTVELVVL